MNQKKIGLFLKTLRKEKNLTQEELAEKLNVSGRTVSRWETGTNMPDISLLIEVSEFYKISIPEIIDGERKSEKMNEGAKDTAIKMAEYSKNEVKAERKKIVSLLLMVFGIFIIVSALSIFPNESSWGSIYSLMGGIILIVGIYFGIKTKMTKKSSNFLCIIGCAIMLFAIFTVTDYIGVSQFHQVPRFCYEKQYGDEGVEYKTLFYDVIQKDPGTETESVKII